MSDRNRSDYKIPAAKIFFPDEDIENLSAQIREILKTGRLTLGSHGKAFENQFSKYVGVKHGIAVNSGTASLEIILRCLNISGSSVVIPTNTFAATAFAAIHAGGDIILTDVGNDLCLNPDDLNERLRKDTKAVILVHIGGNVTSRIEDIMKVCEDNNVVLIEDAAHAHGSSFKGKMAGGFGIAGSMSFYPTKVITSAEGGIILTDDDEIDTRAMVFRDQGKAGFLGNVHTELGYNWRMSEIHAAVGISQLNRLDEFIEKRQAIAKIYDDGLKGINSINSIHVPEEVCSNYYKYIALLDEGIDRKTLKQTLKEKYNVGLSGEVYELPLHLQPIFKKICGHKEGDFPRAEDLCKRHVCLPVFPTLTSNEAEYVVDSIKGVI
jgi:dTDP-4-amino-4,6-dideoxygalactose transaminase